MDYIKEMNNLVASIDVREYEGQPVVSSREVANNFEKKHKHVLECIENLKEGVAEKSADLFIESKYQHPQNKQWYKEYLLTRDGFSLLVMGFTGAKALEWKLKYIEAFNKMEQYIKEQQVPQLTEKQMLQLQILNGDEMERIGALKQYEGVITKPLIDTIEKQSDAINELKPHAEYAERVLEDKKTLLTPTQIAKDFGMAGKALNALLHDLGVQYKQNGQWLLYAKYQGKGYTGPYQPDIPNAKPQTRWTQAGKKFIHDILRKNGYKTILENQQEQQCFDFN
ncbi:MAG: Rha family transcriptional regulator [Intestinibacter bartlettii]|uniref:Rha family transcriptional regulator n=1 Tax=Intestinibacter bartlettii TaxID=261299 RepID=UPI0039A05B2D